MCRANSVRQESPYLRRRAVDSVSSGGVFCFLVGLHMAGGPLGDDQMSPIARARESTGPTFLSGIYF